MKVKIFALVAAFFMLMGGSAWAQADVKGDVNGDGVVNEQDIAAILLIMQQAGGVEQDVKYYWYVGAMSEADATNTSTLLNKVNGQNATSNTSGPSTLIIPNETNELIVFIYPTIWGKPNITDVNGYGTGDTIYSENGLTTPTGYDATAWSGDSAVRGETLKITWTK